MCGVCLSVCVCGSAMCMHGIAMKKVAVVELSRVEPSSAKTKLTWILHWYVQACDGKNRNCIYYRRRRRRHYAWFGVQCTHCNALVAVMVVHKPSKMHALNELWQ